MNTIKSLLSDASLEFLRQMLNAVEVELFARYAYFSLNRSQQIEIPINEIIIRHQHQGSPTQAVKLTSSWLDAGGMGDIYKLEIESQPNFTFNLQLYPDLRVNMRCKIKPNRIYTFGREYSSVIHARDIDFLSKQTIFTGYTLTENQMFNISHESIIWIEQDHYNFLIIKCNFNGFEVTYNDFATQNFLLYLWEDERNERWYRKMRVIE